MTEILPAIVYFLCLVTSAACAALLGRSYRRLGMPLLFWSSLCFLLLALNSLFVMLDLLVFSDIDLGAARLALSLGAVSVLLFGFIWNREDME